MVNKICRNCIFYTPIRKNRGYCKYWKNPKKPLETSTAFQPRY